MALGSAGFEHNLYNYGSTSPVPLSGHERHGRSGSGRTGSMPTGAPGAALAVLAYAFWRRGATGHAGAMAAPGGCAAAAALACWVRGRLAAWLGSGAGSSGTPTCCEHLPARVRAGGLRAQAERELLGFEHLPLPRITA